MSPVNPWEGSSARTEFPHLKTQADVNLGQLDFVTKRTNVSSVCVCGFILVPLHSTWEVRSLWKVRGHWRYSSGRDHSFQVCVGGGGVCAHVHACVNTHLHAKTEGERAVRFSLWLTWLMEIYKQTFRLGLALSPPSVYLPEKHSCHWVLWNPFLLASVLDICLESSAKFIFSVWGKM